MTESPASEVMGSTPPGIHINMGLSASWQSKRAASIEKISQAQCPVGGQKNVTFPPAKM